MTALGAFQQRLQNSYPDIGSEFAKLSELEHDSHTKVYFAHPYSSLEKGGIEKHNGLIRRFLRKGKRTDSFRADDILAVSFEPMPSPPERFWTIRNQTKRLRPGWMQSMPRNNPLGLETSWLSVSQGQIDPVCIIGLNSEIVIVIRCTPLGSICTPHRPFVKRYSGEKHYRLCSDRFRIAVEPVFVKRYRITLVNRSFYKKKLDTRFDTHCIKTGVQLWRRGRDSNP